MPEGPERNPTEVGQRLAIQVLHIDLIARTIELRLFNASDSFLHKFSHPFPNTQRQ
jgi:hypothetical protein